MSEYFYKEKIKTFIIGLLLGLLIGGGFFLLKLNDYVSDFKSLKMLIHSNKDTVVTIVPMQNNNLISDKKSKNDFSAAPKNVVKKTTDSSAQKNNFSTTNSQNTNADSLSNTTEQDENTDNIVVKTDQLLLTKIIYIKNLDPPLSKKQMQSDSLLAQVSDTKNDAVSSHFFRVEYWTSPLNYKGYKMSKNKILVYGMDLTADIKLFQKEEFVYLKTPDFSYKLAYTDDFRQYEKVNDKDMLAQLK